MELVVKHGFFSEKLSVLSHALGALLLGRLEGHVGGCSPRAGLEDLSFDVLDSLCQLSDESILFGDLNQESFDSFECGTAADLFESCLHLANGFLILKLPLRAHLLKFALEVLSPTLR